MTNRLVISVVSSSIVTRSSSSTGSARRPAWAGHPGLGSRWVCPARTAGETLSRAARGSFGETIMRISSEYRHDLLLFLGQGQLRRALSAEFPLTATTLAAP